MGALDNPHDVGPVKLAWLDRSHFRWLYDHSVWIDVEGKRILSYEYVADHYLEEIEGDLRKLAALKPEWIILFNKTPPAGVVDAIIAKATGRA